MKLIHLIFLAAAVAWSPVQYARADSHSTDAQKIADALRAGPSFVTRGATILDWPATPGGEYRVLRKGSSQWTCLPGIPGLKHDEPACLDPVFLQFFKDEIAGRTPHVSRVGISYMYEGAWVPNKTGHSEDQDYHVGPHIMIVPVNQGELAGLNKDGSNGEAYVNHLAHRSRNYLVIPIREWNETGSSLLLPHLKQ